MGELRLNPGTNPNIDPKDVERIYGLCKQSVERWFPYRRFLHMTLIEYIEPTAYFKKYPTLEFANQVGALAKKEYGSVKNLYKKVRLGWTARLRCFLLHRRHHHNELRHVGAEGSWFRECRVCVIIKES